MLLNRMEPRAGVPLGMRARVATCEPVPGPAVTSPVSWVIPPPGAAQTPSARRKFTEPPPLADTAPLIDELKRPMSMFVRAFARSSVMRNGPAKLRIRRFVKGKPTVSMVVYASTSAMGDSSATE
jgi:hypothetical protein